MATSCYRFDALDLAPGLSLRVPVRAAANDVRTRTVFYRDKSARQQRSPWAGPWR
jgi:hypothetical protein